MNVLTLKTINTFDVPVNMINPEMGGELLCSSPHVEYYKLLAKCDLKSAEIYLKEKLIGITDEILDSNKQCWDTYKDKPITPLPVRIAYDGTVCLLDGHHRFCVAVAQGLSMIPVEVKYSNPLWDELIIRLLKIYNNKKQLYQPIEHPWFFDWTVCRTKERLTLIHQELHKLNLLPDKQYDFKLSVDFGCCTGWLCRQFAELGFHSIGVDFDQNVLWIANYLNTIFKQRITPIYYQQDIRKITETFGIFRKHYFDAATCLSVLHHWMWKEAGSSENDVLNMLKILLRLFKIVIIDTASVSDPLVKITSIPLKPDTFIQWAAKTFELSYINYLGTPDENRPIYALSTWYRA
jgi:SAM-dependent methyltransferase